MPLNKMVYSICAAEMRKVRFLFIKAGVIICFFFLNCLTSFAQKPHLNFEHITTENGLSYNTVFSICQDKYGFLWFGTENGLNRYDGYGFRAFKYDVQDPYSISNNKIWDIVKDKNGTMWFATENGLCYYDYDKECFIRFKHDTVDINSLGFNTIRSLFVDKENNLWIGTYGAGLDFFNQKSKIFEHFKHSEKTTSISDNHISDIFVDSHNMFWVATDGGLDLFDRKTKIFTHFRNNKNINSISSNYVICIKEDRKSNLWVGTWGAGLNKIKSGYEKREIKNINFERINFNFSKSKESGDEIIQDIIEDKKGNLWIATRGEGIKFHKFSWSDNIFCTYKNDDNNPKSLSINYIVKLFEDNKDIVWIGTFSGGINKYDNKKFDLYQEKPFFKNLYSISVQNKNDKDIVWLGSQSEGLFRWDMQNDSIPKQFKKFLINQNNGYIHILYKDNSDRLWIGTDKGLKMINCRNNNIINYEPSKLSSVEVYSLFVDHENWLWIGSYKSGLTRLNLNDSNNFIYEKAYFEKIKNNHMLETVSDSIIRYIFEDSYKILWIGTEKGGLNRLDHNGKKFIIYQYDEHNSNSLSNNYVRTIFEDSKKNIWVGTANGLNCLEKAKKFNIYGFRHFTKKEGLLNNSIRGILEDNNKNIWVSTDSGIYCLNTVTNKFIIFSSFDGLQGDGFADNVCSKGVSGLLYFGGYNGLNIINPDSINIDHDSIFLLVTDLKIMGNSVTVGKMSDGRIILSKSIIETNEIDFEYKKDRIIEFKFTGLNHNPPEKIKYSYILDGNNDTIIAGKDKTAKYTSLGWFGWGKYILTIKATDGICITEKEIKINILPPLWGSWLALITYVTFFLFFLYVYIKLRTKQLKARNKELDEKVKKRTSELEYLNEAGQELTRGIQLREDEIIKLVHKHASNLIKIENMSISLYDSLVNEIRFSLVMEAGKLLKVGEGQWKTRQINEKERGKTEEIILTREHILINSYKQHQDWYNNPERKEFDHRAISFLGVPMVSRGKVLGVITIYDLKHENKYNDQDKKFMLTLARQTAIALDNVKLFNKIQQITKTYSISALSKSIDAVLQKIAKKALEVLEADIIILYRYDQKKRIILWPPITSGLLFQAELIKYELTESSVPYRFLLHGINHFAFDSKKDKMMNPELKSEEENKKCFVIRENISSSAGIMLKVSNEIVGVLFINYRKSHEFDENEKQIIELYSSYIALAIQNVLHFREKEISDASKTLGDITGRFAHKMKNDLASMGLYLEDLLRNVNHNNENYFPLNESNKILNGLIMVINHLLELSKLKIQKKEKINIAKIVNEFQTEILSSLNKKNIKFNLNIEGNLPELFIDQKQIKIVFSNLADNSVYFMENGGTIGITVYKEMDTIFIEWTDTGPGISINEIEKIFEFAFTTKISGFGLGLFHSRAMIEDSGGSISVDGNFRNGAKFIIRLPIK